MANNRRARLTILAGCARRYALTVDGLGGRLPATRLRCPLYGTGGLAWMRLMVARSDRATIWEDGRLNRRSDLVAVGTRKAGAGGRERITRRMARAALVVRAVAMLAASRRRRGNGPRGIGREPVS